MSTFAPSQPTVTQDSELVASLIAKSLGSQLLSTAGGSDALLPKESQADPASNDYATEISLSHEAWKQLVAENVSIRSEPYKTIWGTRFDQQIPPVDSFIYNNRLGWDDYWTQAPVLPQSFNFGLQSGGFAPNAALGQIPFVVGAYANYATHALSLADVPQESPSLRQVNVQPLVWLRIARTNMRDSRERLLLSLGRDLDRSKSVHVARAPRDIVTELSEEYGLNQLSTARAIGVTPTAVRKWRRGEQARAEYQDRLATLTALAAMLRETGKEYPAAWLEVPISSESTLTPIDLFAAGRPELVLSLASDPEGIHAALDDFDPAWRRNYASDRDYMIILDSDGERAIVPREAADT